MGYNPSSQTTAVINNIQSKSTSLCSFTALSFINIHSKNASELVQLTTIRTVKLINKCLFCVILCLFTLFWGKHINH